MLGICLLGPVSASTDGVPIRMSRPLERALLARLALSAGQIVESSRLQDDLWIEAPERAQASLQTLVYRLRQTLGAEGPAVMRQGGGYLLKVDARRVDAGQFHELESAGQKSYEAGEPEKAVNSFAAALELWRGTALADAGDAPFVVDARAYLQESRLSVFERWVQAGLECGRHHLLIGKIEEAIVDQPLREGLWVSLMLALYRSGRQADALGVFHRLRHLLAEELGVDPSPPVAAMHQAVLEHDPRLEWVKPPSPTGGRLSDSGPRSSTFLGLPPTLLVERSGVFVDRAVELALAEKLRTDPNRNRLGVLWILGEPGIGKTRLAAQIALQAHASGALVMVGRCDEDLSIPYQPFLEALLWFVSQVPQAELAGRIGDFPDELSRLVPAIGGRPLSREGAESSSPQIEQHRLFEGIRSWLARAGAGRPVVLMLDDLHWATPPTMSMLAHIARSAEPSRTLFVCTARNTLPDDNPALADLILDLERLNVPGYRLELGGLPLEAVGELVESVRGRPLDADAWETVKLVHGDTAGNPLLLDALLCDLETRPGGISKSIGTLSAIVGQRLARQDTLVAELLRTASIAGFEFDLRVVARAAGRAEAATLSALEAAQRAGLVAEESANHFRFRHALVRDVLRDRLSKSRLVRTHLRIGEALESVEFDHPEEHAAELAFHFREAVAVGGAAKACRYSILAAERALTQLSYDQAVTEYKHALELLKSPGTQSQFFSRFDLLMALGDSERKAGNMFGALECFRAASEEAFDQSAPEDLARAATAFEDSNYWLGASGHEAIEPLRRAEGLGAGVGDSSLRALALAGLSRALLTSDLLVEGEERKLEALAMAERLGDASACFAVKFRTTPSGTRVQDARKRATQWLKLAEEARELGDSDSFLLALAESLWANAMLGDIATWDQLFADYSSLAIRLRQPRWDCWLDGFRGFRSMLAADLKMAGRYIERSQQVGEGFGWAREGLYGVSMYLLHREQGNLANVLPAVEAAVQINSQTGLWRPGLCRLYADLGRFDDARREYDLALTEELHTLPSDGSLDLSLGLLGEVCLELGDADRAPFFLELLQPCEGRLLAFTGCAASLGPVDRLLGMLASLADRPDEARTWLSRSVVLARHLESPLWTAHCLYDCASHLAAHDRRTASLMLAEAGEICAEHRLITLGRRVEEFGY